MSVQKREVEFAKEMDDVGAFLEQIVADAKAGKSIPEIAAGSLTGLVNAVSGIDQADDEAKANLKVACQTIGFRVGGIAAILVAPKSGGKANGGDGDPV